MIQTSFKRYEKKYKITEKQKEMLCEEMKKYMREDDYGKYSLCNIYYDTPDMKLIRASLEKPIYKEKLRVRSYGVPKLGEKIFVEIKKKYDGDFFCQPKPRVSRFRPSLSRNSSDILQSFPFGFFPFFGGNAAFADGRCRRAVFA